MVYSPEFHWRLAAKWANKDFDKFIDLDGDEQSRIIAAFETYMQLEAVMAAEANRQAVRKNNRKRR